jgi:small subunit ribosomal protein S1
MTENNTPINEFEAALQESLDKDTLAVGDVVTGTIVAIHGDVVLVDIGGKSEGVLPREELDQPGTGDPVEVVVTSIGDQIAVSHRQALDERLKERLGVAAETGEPVEGKVAGRRKGGFDIIIGGVRAFCPMSQIDDARSDDLDRHLGEVYTFKVLEYAPEDRKLVVSRAAHLKEEKERLRTEAWAKLEEGGVVEGTVRSVTDFGAFVDLGGVDGLVHVTEISHQRIGKPADVLSTGDAVTVKVIGLDQEKNRISLSIKQLQPNPWDDLIEKHPAGSAFEGTVVRLAPFGAFVEILPGVDGLLHVSQLPPGVDLKSEEMQVGATINGWIKDIDQENGRVGLTLRRVPDRDPWERVDMRYQDGQVVDGVVEHGVDFGVFVELEPGLSALIPASETGLPREADPRTSFEPGQKVQAKILSVDPSRRRMSLSIKAFKRDQERSEYMKHMSSGESAEPGVTGFGQQLMNALKKGK